MIRTDLTKGERQRLFDFYLKLTAAGDTRQDRLATVENSSAKEPRQSNPLSLKTAEKFPDQDITPM